MAGRFPVSWQTLLMIVFDNMLQLNPETNALASYHGFMVFQVKFTPFLLFPMGFDPTIFISLILVITIHEYSHAFVAYFLGDPTAKLEGRLTLNPIAHLDPMGTLMMLMVHIGWGKPVPVNSRNFKNPKVHEALTALAGPLSNVLLAILLSIPVIYFPDVLPEFLYHFFLLTLDVSIVLFAFNMLPLPPLDGSKILGILVPKKYEWKYEEYLEKGPMWFVIFLLADGFLLSKIVVTWPDGTISNLSLIQKFIGLLFTLTKSLIFLGN